MGYGEFFGIKTDRVDGTTRVKAYEEMGVFDNLDEATIKRGKELSAEYNLVSSQDVLWYFRYLITACCPRESSGNKSELEAFLKITNNKLTLTSFEEATNDGSISIRCKINGKPFIVNNLPTFFSLRLIYELNIFLAENFGSSFYIFQWDRNPWEQQTFIYFTKERLEKLDSPKEFNELYGEIVDFYENH